MSAAPHWMDWQREHDDALRALQEAQRVYHRAVSGHAFAAAAGASSEATRDALRAVDRARVLLDDVRARQPR
jgi:hypothetical protein